MKNIELFEALGNMDDKYIVDARIKQTPVMASPSEHNFSGFFKSAVSVAAIFIVLGTIFVWTLVGKDIINAYFGDETTEEVTTTVPDTTPEPVTTTNNVLVPPITTTTPVTTEPESNIGGFDPKSIKFDHLWEIGYQMGWPTEKLYSGVAYRIENNGSASSETFKDLTNYVEKLPQCLLSQSFYSTDQIDFMKVMFSLRETPVTNEDEFQKVAAVITATNNMDRIELVAGGNIYKITTEDVEYINGILTEYFRDSFTDQMKKTLDDKTFYVEEYDAYYTVLDGDYRDLGIDKLEKAWIMENGNIVMSISNAINKSNARAYYLSLVVIRNVDDKWVIDQIMHISTEIANNLSSNADTSIFDDLGLLLKRLRESELKIDSLILEDWSEDCLQGIFDLLTTRGIGYALMTAYSGDPLKIDVSQLINAAGQSKITDQELRAYLKACYEREKQSNEAFDHTFEEYYELMQDHDYSCCTSAELSANLQKFFGISLTDEIKAYFDSQAVYIEEYDKYYTIVGNNFEFSEFRVYYHNTSTGEQLLLVIPGYEEESHISSAKAVIITSSEDGYVISQIATIYY